MNKNFFLIIAGLFCFLSSYGQCAYTGTPLTAINATPYTFCIDNNNTITTPVVQAGQFALVNVVQGFRYNFSVGDVFSGTENLTVFNATNNATVGPSGFNSGLNGATITNWTATFSGQIKVLLSRDSCINDATAGGVLSLELVALGNTLDDPTLSGTNQWVGHVYNYGGGWQPGGPSSTAIQSNVVPFQAANYVGNYVIASESINTNFGGSAACLPVMSNGVNRVNMFTDRFAVRYRMRSTRPAGCYIMNINGDDGVRVYVDGVLIFDRWVDQPNTNYCGNLINLTGNNDIVLDFYENIGFNDLGFSLTPFDGSGNTVDGPNNVLVCSGTQATLVASNLIGCNVNTNTAYQWQSSTDNITFTNIAGATSKDYTVPAVTVASGSQNNIRFFRRVFRPTTLGAACTFNSNVITVTTTGDRPSGPGAISGNTTVCRTTTVSYSIAAVANASSYVWSTTGTGWTITPAANGLSVSIAFGSTATSGNLTVFASNGCGLSFSSSTTNIQVGALPTTATISGTTTVCLGAPAPAITITNPQPYGVNVTYNINGGSNIVVYVGPSSSINYITTPTGTTGVFVYNLVSVANGIGFPNCSTNLSGSATVTVGTATGDQVAYGANSWIGYVYTSAAPQNSNFSSNFVGSVNQPEIFDLNLGDGALSAPTLCGPYSDNFAIRFKMNRNFPAGCYIFTVGGDDGYRLSLDGGATFVVNNWGFFPYQTTTSQAVYLSGNTNLVLEYFEGTGQSRVSFSYSVVPLERPTVAARIQPSCITPTGSVQLTGLPAGAWTLARTGSSTGTISGSGTQTTVSGLAAGTYQFAVTSGSCTSPPTGNVVINPVITTTYTGSTWSTPPTIDMLGIINSNTPITTNVELCNCTVNATNATIAFGRSLTLQDRLVVNGNLTFESNASLVQINDVVNIGNIRYQRETTPIKRFDYTYWSSPVANQKLFDLSPLTNPGRYYSFNPVTEAWVQENPQNLMGRGTGYIIRAPENTAVPPAPLSTYLGVFQGVPHNGAITLSPVVAFKPYLLGNPYPSALDADAFIAANANVLHGTLYFWTHNTSRGVGVSNPGTGFYAYSADDYATYNTTGGTAVAPSDPDKSIANPFRPTGKIAAGQGFFASTLENMTGTSIVFNNSMRLGPGNVVLDNSQFFKTASSKSKSTTVIEKHRVWLNLTNTQGAFKQMLVGYISGATNNYDSAYDGSSFNGNEFIDFYSINDTKTLTIQGRALPFEESDEIPLGYSTTIQGSFSISIDQVDGLLSSRKVYLEDKIKNTVHDLKQGPYTFETVKGVFNERFVLRYIDKTLNVTDLDAKSNQVLVSVKDKVIKVDSAIESIDKVYVYTVSGAVLYEKQNVDAFTFSIPSVPAAQQVLIVKTVLQNGNVNTTKVIY